MIKVKFYEETNFKETMIGKISNDWKAVELGNSRYFEILASGIQKFDGVKWYLSTKCVEGSKIVDTEGKITYLNRPSRANMQPILNSVWFAKMKNTIKVYCFIEKNSEEKDRYILSTGFCGIRCNERVFPLYIKQFFLFHLFNRMKDAFVTGSTQQDIKQSSVEKLVVTVSTLEEQKSIALILSTVDEVIEKVDKITARTERLKKGLTQELLTKGIGHTEYRDTPIGKIPQAWTIEQLEQLCTTIVDCPHSTPKFTDQGVLVIRNFNIRDGKLSLEETFYTTEDEWKERTRRCIPDNGDVLFSREAPIGESCLAPKNTKFSLGQRTMLIRPKHELLDSRFLVYTFYSPIVRRQLRNLEAGVTAHHVNVADVKKLKIPLPKLLEQLKIAEILSTTDDQIDMEKKEKIKLQNLKRGLMDLLLTGKVRVKVD